MPLTTEPSGATRRRFRLPTAVAALALVLGACGSSGDETTTTGAGAGAGTSEASSTTKATTKATEDTAEKTEDTEAAAEGQAVELTEWKIVIDGKVTAGAASFALSNTGKNPHALAVAKGKSYADLPQKAENGAVDAAKLGADFLGASQRVESGASGTFEVDLEPGDYVFFCPIEFGPNSHAKAGQVLSVTVS